MHWSVRLLVIFGWFFFVAAVTAIFVWGMIRLGPWGPDPRLTSHWFASEWLGYKLDALKKIWSVSVGCGAVGGVAGGWISRRSTRWAAWIGGLGLPLAIGVAWFILTDFF
jgi:hypothetical protein